MTSGPRITPTHLADGRELLYFDRPGTPQRSGVDLDDRRRLQSTTTSSELRFDRLTDEWVTIASHRQGRSFMPGDDECPLCPSTDGHSTEIPAHDYQVVVFENRYPSFSEQAEPVSDRTGPDGGEIGGGGLFVGRPGRGRAEVVSFSPDHAMSFAQLDLSDAETVMAAWTQRSSALSALEDVGLVFVFENRGVEIGVTLTHPHGQIYAYPFVPPHAGRVERAAARHLATHGRCLGCDTVAAEAYDSRRLVGASRGWVAYVPFAARWPFEVHITPHRHVSTLDELGPGEATAFCELYLDVLRRFDGLFDLRMPYIAGWHQPPVRAPREGRHLRMEVVSTRRARDKLKHLAGSESAQGAFINDISPEHAAAMLRDAGPRP